MADTKDILKNYKYAPGIATYGAEGKQGTTGINGKSCFFCTYNISVPEELTAVNKKIQNNELLSEYKSVTLIRPYQEKDIIVDYTGTVYKVSILDPSSGLLGIDPEEDKIGEFVKDTDKDFFNLTEEGRLYNQKGNGVDFIKTNADDPTTVMEDSDYVQRIYSDIPDTESRYNLLSYIVQTESDKHNLNIFFNKNDQAFHIECSDKIVVDCPIFAVEPQEVYEDIDGYSQVTGNETNISYLYNLYKKFYYLFPNNENMYLYIPEEYEETYTPEIFLSVVDDSNLIKRYSLGSKEIEGEHVIFDISKITASKEFKKTPQVSLLGPIEVFISEKVSPATH